MTKTRNIFCLLLLIMIITFISGCVNKNSYKNSYNDSYSSNSNYIPKTNLPTGIIYMGTHNTTVDINGSLENAIEGVYKNNGDDLYIQVIENDKSNELVTQYKLKYKDANYNPFENISINGHKATRITDYTTINGRQKPHYTIIWATDRFMFIVSGSSNETQTEMELAAATGY